MLQLTDKAKCGLETLETSINTLRAEVQGGSFHLWLCGAIPLYMRGELKDNRTKKIKQCYQTLLSLVGGDKPTPSRFFVEVVHTQLHSEQARAIMD